MSVARGVNVKKIKGKNPLHGERFRMASVKQSGMAQKVVLGAPRDYLGHIIGLKPHIIALGYDQTSYTGGLKAKLSVRGLSVKIRRMKPYHPQRFKSSLMPIA